MLLALPIGLLIGLSLGALGGGGSILTVPALVYLLGVSPHSATTTSLIIVGITSIVGAAAHLRAGRVRVRSGLVFGVLGAGGAFVGSRLSASIDPNALLIAFSVLMLGAAVTMTHQGRTNPGSEPEVPAAPGAGPAPADGPAGTRGGLAVRDVPALAPARARTAASASPLRIVIAATTVGLVTGFFGVGGGFVVVPALVLALGFDMPSAVGTSLVVITINSASSLLSRLGTHATLDPVLMILFTGAAIVGTAAGSRVASKARPGRLVVAFAILMIAVALYTAARSISALA